MYSELIRCIIVVVCFNAEDSTCVSMGRGKLATRVTIVSNRRGCSLPWDTTAKTVSTATTGKYLLDYVGSYTGTLQQTFADGRRYAMEQSSPVVV